jgi:hypothetical protein
VKVGIANPHAQWIGEKSDVLEALDPTDLTLNVRMAFRDRKGITGYFIAHCGPATVL